VTSKDGQKVSGDWAIYDTATDTVTVGGDVMLSQGSNVVRGTKLVIDMASGNSTIETAAGSPKAGVDGWSASGAGGPAGTAAQGRPSAVFFPDQLKAARDKAEGTGKSTDSWAAETAPGGGN
jgi:lipopolysaccharide export system protein LptA